MVVSPVFARIRQDEDRVADDVHEVLMKIEVRATSADKVAFAVELEYAGLFGIRNVPEDQIQPFLLAEAPRLIFPFARRVLADAVRDGGFPPLMLEPIDFGALFLQQTAQNDAMSSAAIEGNA